MDSFNGRKIFLNNSFSKALALNGKKVAKAGQSPAGSGSLKVGLKARNATQIASFKRGRKADGNFPGENEMPFAAFLKRNKTSRSSSKHGSTFEVSNLGVLVPTKQ